MQPPRPDAVVLEAGSLRLEPLTVDHADEMYPVLARPELYRFLDESPPVSPGALRERYRRQIEGPPSGRDEAWLNWIVRLGLTPQGGLVAASVPRPAIGFVQATVVGRGTAWIGFVISTPWQGRGHARTAISAMLEELVGRLGIHRFLATIERENVASERVLVRNGFRRADALELREHPCGPTERRLVRHRHDGIGGGVGPPPVPEG